MVKVYEIWAYDEVIDVVYCYSLSEANGLAEEIYPNMNIHVEEK